MAFDKATLIADFTAIFEDLTGKTAAQKATEMANAIDKYSKTGTPVVPGTGLSSPSGAVTGTSNTGSLV